MLLALLLGLVTFFLLLALGFFRAREPVSRHRKALDKLTELNRQAAPPKPAPARSDPPAGLAAGAGATERPPPQRLGWRLIDPTERVPVRHEHHPDHLGDLQVTVSTVDATRHICVRGELARPSTDRLLDTLSNEPAEMVVLHLDQVGFIDVAGATAVLQLRARVVVGGGRLVVCTPPRTLLRILDVYQLAEPVEVTWRHVSPGGP